MQPINTALCSFGMSGWVFHAPFIRINPGFNFYAVWERTKNMAQQKYPGVKTYRSLEEMLSDENIELVIVNTPNFTHFEYAKLALQAGKHVIVEKPFTVNAAEGMELIQLAQANNAVLSVYQNRRYDSDYRTVKRVLQDGLLGNIVEAEIHYDRFKEELSPKVHKEVPGPGTGALYDLGSHLIDQALQLFGMPNAVFADIAVMRPVSKVDDYFELLMYYSTFRVRIKSSYQVREVLPGYVFHGSKGSFIKPKTDVQEDLLQAGEIPGGPSWGTEPETQKGLLNSEIKGELKRGYIDSERGNYGDYYDGMYQAIRNGKPAPVSAEDGLKVIQIIQSAFESHKKGRVIQIA